MAPCYFYAQGLCSRGDSCKFEHVPKVSPTTNNILRADVKTFVPSRFSPAVDTTDKASTSLAQATVSETVCIFYTQNRCKHGAACKFRHERPIRPSARLAKDSSIASEVNDTEDVSQSLQCLKVDEDWVRDMKGAQVTFRDGADVHSIRLASDLLVLQLTNLKSDVTPENIRKAFKDAGQDVGTHAICIKRYNDTSNTIEIALNKTGELSVEVVTRILVPLYPALTVHVTMAASSVGALSNKVQMNTVTCSWYRPSRVAWLHYRSSKWATWAAGRFAAKGKRCRGRELSSKVMNPPGRFVRQPIWSVELGNLDVGTVEEDLNPSLKGILPDKIIIGKASYTASHQEACDFVRSQLVKHGPLQSWDATEVQGATRMKAIAKFEDPSHARAAVTALSGDKVRLFGNSKLFLNHTISIKFLVLIDLFNTVRSDLESLKNHLQTIEHVQVQVYIPEQRGKAVTVRVSGEHAKAVSKAKIAFENLVAGLIVTDEDGAIVWNEFFASVPGLNYLREINQPGKIFVYRDARRRRLTLHGASEAFETVRQTIIAKVKRLSELTHHIVLSQELLKRALTGGYRTVVERLGHENARLEISKRPPVMAIFGSLKDLQLATAVLNDLTGTTNNIQTTGGNPLEVCPVCTTEADQPVRLPCGHAYCSECFSGQCQSADGYSFPLKCLGDADKCARIFSNEELHVSLSRVGFETTLQKSLDAYLRIHSQEYQYCPTADCPNIYRVTREGNTTTCQECLTTICTSCQIVSHDGLTCEENKDLCSEGTEAFKKWKEDHDVRDCPTCKMAIEKTFGCNHMECASCHAHICWFCMEVFANGSECYGHMTTAHRTWVPV